jgi:AcrR family transcriptional regulator
MTKVTERTSAWQPLRESQRNAVVEAVLRTIGRGDAPLIADLAAQAGMSRVTFYKYFPTIGAAMLHTHRTVLAELLAYVAENSPDSPASARERLLAMFDLSFEYTRMNVDVLRFFSYFDFTFRRHGLTPAEREELTRIVDESGDQTRDLFVEGQADGSIDRSLPIDSTVMAISGSILGLAQRLLVQDEYPGEQDDQARTAHRLHIEACRRLLTPTTSVLSP